jgi:hypothetical protein
MTFTRLRPGTWRRRGRSSPPLSRPRVPLPSMDGGKRESRKGRRQSEPDRREPSPRRANSNLRTEWRRMTATATKTKNGLQKVKEAEAAWVAAEDAHRTETARHAALLRRHKELEDARRHLIRRDPELVDHLGAPIGEGNPVSDVDKEITGLDDLVDSDARVKHRREIARSKKQARDALIANHAGAIRKEEYVNDEALRSSFIETMTRAHEIARQRVDVCKRLMEIAAICRESSRSVHIDAAAEARRRVQQLAEEPPPPAGGE